MPMSLDKPEHILPLTMVKPPLRSPPPCSIKPWVMPTGMSNVWTPYWAEKLPSWEEDGSARSSKWPTTSETASDGSESKEIGGISNSSSPRLGVWNVCRGKKRGKIIWEEEKLYTSKWRTWLSPGDSQCTSFQPGSYFCYQFLRTYSI